MRILLRSSVLLCLIAAACGARGDDGTADGSDNPVDAPETPSSEVSVATTAPFASSESTAEPRHLSEPAIDVPAQADLEALTEFVSVDPADDGPFYMVNLIEYRDEAVYDDGRPTNLSGREADAIYGEWMRTEQLPSMGAEIVYIGEVERDLIGGTDFDLVAVVRYPSRAEFFAMVRSNEFQNMLVHKNAGVADTTVLATSIQDLPAMPPVVDPPFPSSADDPSFAFVHLLDYRDTAQYAVGDADADPNRSGRDAVALYSQNASTVAPPLGVRPVAWFNVEAVIRGAHDGWEEVRINLFPSHATFTELTSDPDWAAARHHREAGIERTYAIQTLPLTNQFAP